jgi:hypothetical protein
MKQALISPNEPRETGYRVAEVCDVVFEVASPLFWVACADDVVADEYWYDPTNQTIKPIPQPEPAPDQPITTGAQTL